MNSEQIPGLLRAIDLVFPAIEKHRRILADEEGSPLYITEHLRGILRTYALVVGGLKIELERVQGLDFATRFVAHDDFTNGVEAEEELHTKLAQAAADEDSDETERLQPLWIDALKRTDTAAIQYATLPLAPPTSPSVS
jgi:hypothetical protein